MAFDYECPACEEAFESSIKDGEVECPNCGEELEVINGKSAYLLIEEEDEDEEFEDEDEEQ